MEIIQIYILIFLSIILTGCMNSKSDKELTYFNTLVSQYFKDYKPDEYTSIDKPEIKRLILGIKKSSLSLDDYNVIHNKLKSDGWKIISDKDNFYEYCFGENLYIASLYPEKEKYYNLAGNEIIPFNQNEWAVILNYNKNKVNYCRNEKLPIIELEEI